MTRVGGTPSLPDLPGGPHGNYKVSPEFKKFWESLFKGYPLTQKELSQMTDQFVKFTWDQMSRVLQHALKVQKELDKKQKRDEGG